MNDAPNGGETPELNPNEPIDLGAIAGLFQKWPGPTLMAVGAILAFAATGIRVDGVGFSGHNFAGVEFAAVFLGGMLLIALGIFVLLVRERFLVEDENRRLAQEHEVRLETARAASMAGILKATQLNEASNDTVKLFMNAYQNPPSR